MVQSPVTGDKTADIRHALELAAGAAAGGTDLIVFPEMFCCPYSTASFRAYGEEEGGEAFTALSRFAAEQGAYVVGGSVPELDGGRVYNTSYSFDRSGRKIARHRKVHLFDIAVDGGQHFRESDVLSPGEECTVFDTDFGKVGVCICFDLRFQELSREMADRGAGILVVPGAFNMTTGPAHWELHFRARAVDNQVFTVGVAPARDENGPYVSYGNSICADPWGEVVERFGAGETAKTVELDLGRIESIRRQLPIRSARRGEGYR